MRKHCVILLLVFGFNSIMAQSPLGLWENVDEDDGELQSYIEIYEQEGALHGKVVKLMTDAKVKHCQKCEGDEKGASLLGMNILANLVPTGNAWDHGSILDPKKGKRYKCKISLADENTLKVRGYIGRPLFGKTFKWKRVSKSAELQINSSVGF